MPTRIVNCPDCGTAVPYGRLSCVACGALLASVAGTRQRAVVAAAAARPSRAPRLPRRAAPKVARTPEPTAAAPTPEPPAAQLPPEPAVGAPSPRAPLAVPSLVAAPAGPAIAGAYLPPSAVFAMTPAAPIARAPIARATIANAPIPKPIQPKPIPSTAPSTPARGAPTPGRAGLLSDIPLDAPDDLATWLVAVGAAFTVIGFVLPWGDNGMIGGGVDAGFFSRWGLANAADSIPLVAALGALWLQLAPNVRRTPVRTALVGLLLGGPLAGLAFVYATSPFGLGTGGVGVVGGAALLLAGGGFALRSRHASKDPAV